MGRALLAIGIVFAVILIAFTAFALLADKHQAAAPPVTTQELVRAFWLHGLTAKSPTDMLPRDYGAAPALCKGVRFQLDQPLLYGMAFVCDDLGDLVTLQRHYDNLSRAAGMFATYTYAKGHYLVVIDGNVRKTDADKYGRALP